MVSSIQSGAGREAAGNERSVGWFAWRRFVASGFLLANTGSAYYYYTYFNSTAPPYAPIVARFDLSTLSNNTVPFFISGAGAIGDVSGRYLSGHHQPD